MEGSSFLLLILIDKSRGTIAAGAAEILGYDEHGLPR
jgi:hypothetical protein